MTSERVEELRNRADLIMAWEAFEPGMEAPAPLDYEDIACKLMEAAAEIERLRAALEDARRDLNALCPRSDTGSKRKRAIETAVKRIEDALSPADA